MFEKRATRVHNIIDVTVHIMQCTEGCRGDKNKKCFYSMFFDQ